MKIALDYDKTYSLDPEFWDIVISAARAFDHDVRIVTIRDPRYDRTAPLLEVEKKLPVVYTRGMAKKAWLTNNGAGDNWFPDVWIDDKPETIGLNSGLDQEGLKKWREERNEGPAETLFDRLSKKRGSTTLGCPPERFDVV